MRALPGVLIGQVARCGTDVAKSAVPTYPLYVDSEARRGRSVRWTSHRRSAIILAVEGPPSSEIVSETLYEHAGGDEGLHRLEELFYSKALADPVLKQLFTHRVPALRSDSSALGRRTPRALAEPSRVVDHYMKRLRGRWREVFCLARRPGVAALAAYP
jgi:hypothetical protein